VQRTTKTPINPDHFYLCGDYLMYYMNGKLFTRENNNEAFIARFKYSKPWKTTIKNICKHFSTIEEYLNLLDLGWSPVHALNLKGHRDKHDKEMMAEGTWDAYWNREVEYQKKEEARILAWRAKQERVATFSCACL
jgi:hypothetical protein